MLIRLMHYKIFIPLWIFMFTCIPSIQGRHGLVTSIPFEMAGSYIIIRTQINNSTPLRLIFDTGIRNTIITELHPGDEILLNTADKKPIQGLGQGKSVSSLMSENNFIKTGKLIQTNKTVHLIEEDILGLSKHSGQKINGLAGIDLIRDYVTEINYTRKRIYFYHPEKFKLPKGYIYKPLIIENNKIYLNLTLLDDNAQIRTIKMLIDTGAMLNAWFQTVRSDAAEIPERRVYARIGEGFSGELYGYLARIPKICFDMYCFHNPVVVFPDSVMIADIMKRSDRDGTIGNELLSRFNTIIDMRHKALYLKPNHFFNDKFQYNIAGIEVMQSDPQLPIYEIAYVWKDSPAEKAGMLPGDIITEIKGMKTFTMKLSEIRWHFQRVSAHPMQIIVSRNQDLISFQVEMRDLLNNP